MGVTRRLIPYAGYEPTTQSERRVPVERARELRAQGLSWKQVAWELTVETDRNVQYAGDAVQTAVVRADRREKETAA